MIQDALNKLSDWSLECKLTLNPKKTKVMMLSSAQMSRANGLKTCSLNPTVNGKRLERDSNFRLLGTQVNQHLKWKEEINSKISSCYDTPAIIRKLNHLTPFHVRKQLAEFLILSKIDYNDIVSHPVPGYLIKVICPVGRCRFRSWALCACAGCNQTRMDTNKRTQKESFT